MDKIYIVRSGGGMYDDAWENNLFAVADEQVAQREVQRLKDAHEFAGTVYAELKPHIQAMWDALKAFKPVETPREPKAPSGKATKESRAEYKRVLQEWLDTNRPIWQRNEEDRNAIQQRELEKVLATARSLGCEEEHLKLLGFYNDFVPGQLTVPRFDSDVGYSYEELELR